MAQTLIESPMSSKKLKLAAVTLNLLLPWSMALMVILGALGNSFFRSIVLEEYVGDVFSVLFCSLYPAVVGSLVGFVVVIPGIFVNYRIKFCIIFVANLLAFCAALWFWETPAF